MKRILLMVCVGVFAVNSYTQNKVLPADIQIKTSLLAAPEMFKDGAKVLGYDESGKLITLREGSNGLICLADDPFKEGIHVACYSDKLEAYMSRGRELIGEGKTEKEKREIRKVEIDAGKLAMPSEPAAVYVLTGDDENYDTSTGELSKSHLRFVFYKPYMTAGSTGLPTKPQGPGIPWLMDADTHRAHIMVTPPRN